eukprot:m.64537 g.64537  ORF g.64537 m.64537 type:complete len:247 (-) comp7526_c0_seq2:99-839(-)
MRSWAFCTAVCPSLLALAGLLWQQCRQLYPLHPLHPSRRLQQQQAVQRVGRAGLICRARRWSSLGFPCAILGLMARYSSAAASGLGALPSSTDGRRCSLQAATIADWRPMVVQHAPHARMCKNLFMKDRKSGILMLVVALAETEVDTKILRRDCGVKNPRLATAETLYETLGVKKGAVTPLAMIHDPEKKIKLVFDKAMLKEGETEELLFHPVSGNHLSVMLKTRELLKYIEKCGHSPQVLDFGSL